MMMIFRGTDIEQDNNGWIFLPERILRWVLFGDSFGVVCMIRARRLRNIWRVIDCSPTM